MFLPFVAACLAIGCVGTWLWRGHALRHALIDAPGERRSHVAPTPRGGGIGIVVALLAAGAWLLPSMPDRAWLACALGGTALVALVGLVDDHRPLSPWTRLGVQALAAALLAFGTWHATQDGILAAAAFVLAMGLSNVWNFMDGIDGIASTQALLVGGALAVLIAGAWSWWAWALVAATLGFLPFNYPHARIFLGDVASGTLGFALAALLVRALAGASAVHWALWALPVSAFLVDASLTLAGRVLRGEDWWRPHALHAYQKWARRRGSHVGVTAAYAGWTLASIGAMELMGSAQMPDAGVFAFVAAWYTAAAGIWWMLQGKGSLPVKEPTA